MANDDFFLVKELKKLTIYFPLGALKLASDFRKRAIEVGKAEFENQLNTSKAMGELAVNYGLPQVKAEVEKYLGLINPLKAILPKKTSQTTPNPEEKQIGQRRFLNGSETALDGNLAQHSNLDFPIPDYDSLAASQVINRLESLSKDELETIASYEMSHRQRRTILSKIAQLQGS